MSAKTTPSTTERDAMAEAALYRLEKVSRVYRTGGGEVRALQDVDLQIARAELVAIEGPSGSGKTTMLQILGALDRPTGGTVLLDGQDLSGLSEAERTRVRREQVGFVFQHFNLIPTLTARENVEAPLVGTGADKAARRARAGELLMAVGLADRADHLPSRLSGGEQQRVAIARALANDPRVILADEPTGNLDSATAAEVMGVLASLVRDRGVTVVVVTHAEEVARDAPRRLRMRDGRIVEVEDANLPQGWGTCASCQSIAVTDVKEQAVCDGCGKRYARPRRGTRPWGPCKACGAERRLETLTASCASCGTGRSRSSV